MCNRVVISVENVCKSYGRKEALKGGKMKAKTGELICIAGENGSGKSTLIKIIAGFLKPDKGLVSRTGEMGYCPQQSLPYHYFGNCQLMIVFVFHSFYHYDLQRFYRNVTLRH